MGLKNLHVKFQEMLTLLVQLPHIQCHPFKAKDLNTPFTKKERRKEWKEGMLDEKERSQPMAQYIHYKIQAH